MYLVRIRIYWIIGFSGFYQLIFDWQALIHIRIGDISGYGEKRKPARNEILKIPPILKIPILTNTRNRRPPQTLIRIRIGDISGYGEKRSLGETKS